MPGGPHGGPPGICDETCSSLPPCDEQVCCPDACCPCECDSCGCSRVYGSAEYLLWTIRHGNTPPLASTAPNTNSFPSILLFGGALDQEAQSGGRFTAGYWFDCCQDNGIEGSVFFLGQRSVHFTSSLPLLARTFINAANGQPDAEATAFPGAEKGTINIAAPSRLWGGELDWRHNLCCGCWYRVDLLAGFRYVELDEGLDITENTLLLPGVVNVFPGQSFPPGTMTLVSDRFNTRNQFYGGQIGLNTELRRGRWALDLTTKVALGDNHEVVDIGGNQAVTQPGRQTQFFTGGLLALPSNIGHYERDRFSVVPEAGVTLGYQVTDNLRVFAGYNFLFWSNVVRPGDQIDFVLNENQIPNFHGLPKSAARNGNPGPARPTFQFRESSFWAQGMTAGLELKY
jgi:hypothetical protein